MSEDEDFNLGPIDYSRVVAPPLYKCAGCGVHGIKLWRKYGTFDPSILCAKCACKEQKRVAVQIIHGEMFVDEDRTDQIGWRVPAVPTKEGDNFWGYTSVPNEACAWWDALPLDPK